MRGSGRTKLNLQLFQCYMDECLVYGPQLNIIKLVSLNSLENMSTLFFFAELAAW